VLLADTRERQLRVRAERQAARDGLKQAIHGMLREAAELGEQTGRLQTVTEQHAGAIESADTLEGLAGVVKSMLADSRAMHAAVSGAQARLQADSARASGLEERVRQLEAESRRLSEEVSTDVLTQVANRRGLMQAFEVEQARCQREGGALAVGLIDIDNFKKLNDSLGHTAGDRALKSLAAAVRDRLRPGDHLARFGGEEFVVLLPRTGTDEAQQALTRLQRSLTEALFLYDGREVFVTFSAGVTAWREGEALEAALERADEALYEAKRTGKNRTCAA
jgi:diguanylate cyclase